MPTLKELKNRIQSVRSTQKITSAMKMVSSVKLMKAEKAINSFLPYQQALSEILRNYLSNQIQTFSPYTDIRHVQHVAIVVFASNSSLCGNYNSNMIKRMEQSIVTHRDVRKEDILIFPIGKKVSQACKKRNLKIAGDFEEIAAQPTFENTAPIADTLTDMFLNHEIDRVKVIYLHYVNKSSQIMTADTFLPIEIKYRHGKELRNDYIIEPSVEDIENKLIPLALRYHIYAAALEAQASEYAARTIAMQIATDNADKLLQELSLQYNKFRQESITNQILDLIAGSLH
ncbi:MAG TPA: ATP synthase F1 subunit gamma [Paludibacteraceae bacterium]|nr:ATP synthase F1 subunit gamma [Paludibacteraceae bacterium]HOV84116.1 ATP synthase F1 subunit gamma [Paludibacteraceae bacterium]